MTSEKRRCVLEWALEWDTTQPSRRHNKNIEVYEQDVIATVEKIDGQLICNCGFKSEKGFRQMKLHLYIDHHIPMRALRDFLEKLWENKNGVSVRWKHDRYSERESEI